MEKEIWKAIPDINNYVISNFGRVKYIGPTKYRGPKYSVIALKHNAILKIHSNSYSQARINGQSIHIHRLVLLAFKPIENYEYYQVNHKDGNPANNNLENLEWCSSKENHKYRIQNKNNKIKF